MRVKVTDFGSTPDLADAIRRYYALLRMTFETNLYKIFETPTSQIMKFIPGPVPPGEVQRRLKQVENAPKLEAQVSCVKCGAQFKVQANFVDGVPLAPDCLPFPADNRLKCPGCGVDHDLNLLRRQLEAQVKRRVLTPPSAAGGTA